MKHQCAGRLRRLLVVVGSVLVWGIATVALGWATSEAWAAIRRPGAATLDDTLTVVAAIGAWIALTWLVAGVVLVALSAACGRVGAWTGRAAAAITPYAVRRATAAALGLTLVAGPATASSVPAAATARAAARITACAPLGVAPAPHERDVPDPLPLLDRPAGSGRGAGEDVAAATSEGQPGAASSSSGAWLPERPVALGPPKGREQAAATRLVVGATRPDREQRGSRPATPERTVHRGDTLWSIAAADLTARLGRPATDAETALQWPRWYAANAHVIGPDPGRLLPGQVLRAPDPPSAHAADPTLD